MGMAHSYGVVHWTGFKDWFGKGDQNQLIASRV